jgi:hypothetical protein
MLERRVQEAHHVAHTLVRKPLLQERPREHFDIGRAHIRRLPTAKRGRDMDSLHVLAVLAVGLACAAQLEPSAQRIDDLIDGRHVSARQRPRRVLLGLLHLAERPLGLGTGESSHPPGGRIGPTLRFSIRPSSCASDRSRSPTSHTDAPCRRAASQVPGGGVRGWRSSRR